ncbi:hypothetical protein [Mucilaginibacter glaciei]|uniref:Lipoprotein n=1 Tax=Mucilaginibacter glaciei TaxID=2772109 RepID=A0A926NNC5_9SPHI|nr:hypothetical protein [Mucilaginibacter glaciei]MBD1392057.1 hypothetical protein [Mucilaginibacter glaciei]
MKKFILALVVLFAANVGCKKASNDGGNICACSPIVGPSLHLVIKNSAGQDLLDDKTTGGLTKDKIDLYRKDAAGNIVKIYFGIQPPFQYGEQKFPFYQLFTSDFGFLQSANNIAYLKLDDKLYELSIQLGTNSSRVDKLFIDKKETEKDTGAVNSYVSVFYFTR